MSEPTCFEGFTNWRLPCTNEAGKSEQNEKEQTMDTSRPESELREKINQVDSKLQAQMEKVKPQGEAAKRQVQAKVENLKAKANALKAKVTSAHN
jgi:hypothetical protein